MGLKAKLQEWGQMALGLTALVVPVAIGGWAFGGFLDNTGLVQATNSGDEAGAWVAAKAFVVEQLKSPASASFPWYSKDAVHAISDNSYVVTGYVDAENSFGATLRKNWQVVVIDRGSEWELQRITL
jgi:hypothetical protein